MKKLIIIALVIALIATSCAPTKYGYPGNPSQNKYNRP